MRYFLFLILTTLYTGTPNETKTISNSSFVVMQLFTSQGCSSCPAADNLAERIKKEYANENVFMLSYHVTYWDRLGWKDPYGKRAYTEMQYAYADKFNERNVYTPQIVVNGKEHFIGSDEYILRKKVKQYLKKTTKNPLQLSLTNAEGKLDISYKVDGDLKGKKIVFALVIDKKMTAVKKGENARRNLLNSNIVIDQSTYSLDKSDSNVKIVVPKLDATLRLIAFIQDDQLNISGGAQLAL